MALEVITNARKVRSFLVYDLEWIPGTLQVRMCGVYDGERYRYYSTMAQFLEKEMTSSNRGKWFYAHAGGLADIQFVLHEMQQRKDKGEKFEVRASFSGSSAIIVHVRRGKNAWHFIDSYWLLRDKLANIARWFGMKKGSNVANFDDMTREELKEWYGTVPIETLRTYNEEDCTILWKAIDQFETRLLDAGGQLQMTLASSAMHLFRRRFLTKGVETSEQVNNCAKISYTASRVEVFSADCQNAFYYDINSSFPFAMTKPCPGEMTGSTNRIPDNPDAIYIADCTIEVPDCYFPPLPHRMKNRVFFPVGSWRSWFSSVDLQLLLREGGKIWKVHEVLNFAPFHDLTNYANTLYNIRKNSNDEAERMVYKLLLNSLYGKFAEEPNKMSLHINPNEKILGRFDDLFDLWRNGNEDERSLVSLPEMLFPGAWLEERLVDIPHRHVPISSHITALARRTIFDFMAQCRDFHYCDTDGFSTSEELSQVGYEGKDKDSDNSGIGYELGDLKLEDHIGEAIFVAPKVYRKKLVPGTFDEKKLPGGVKVKAKGFSLGKGEEAQKRFQKLIENEAIDVERMSRIREIYRKGITSPQESTISKKLRGVLIGKRFMYPDGQTRPWSVDELGDMIK